jgi:tRNA pseudouridine55 synthase
MPDGVLVLDKPQGLTSHDVVAAARRALGDQRIGHTGTLDPMATGVLPLACGSATRLVRFLTASDKDYDAEILLGLETDTYDITGREVARSTRAVSRADVAAALETLRGEYLQTPPAFSAKKIEGRRAYSLARAEVPVLPQPVLVRVDRLDLVEVRENVAVVRLTCSAGFYVRSLAHDLGARLGTVACLKTLRRTRSGEFGLDCAVRIDALQRPDEALESVIRPEKLLPSFPAVVLTDEGRRWATHGRLLGPGQMSGERPRPAPWVRLVAEDGTLVGLAQPADADGSLHPSVVLN